MANQSATLIGYTVVDHAWSADAPRKFGRNSYARAVEAVARLNARTYPNRYNLRPQFDVEPSVAQYCAALTP